MEIETVGQLQVYLLLKKADLLEYFTKCKSNRILWFLPLPGGHFNFFLFPVCSIRASPKFISPNSSGFGGHVSSQMLSEVRRTLEFNFDMSF